MGTNRDWIYERLDGDYLSEKFVRKVNEFIEFASKEEHFKKYEMLKCPCNKCWNVPYLDEDTVKLHLYKNGFRPNYYQWTYHGELHTNFGVQNLTSTSNSVEGTSMRAMVMDALGPMAYNWGEGSSNDEEDPNPEVNAFFEMIEAAEKPLYDGCQSSLLSVAARITNLKCEYNIPNRAIDGFASLIKDICPDDNKMAETSSGTKMLLAGLEMPHERIDVCRKGCMLFWKEATHLDKCEVCHADRYVKKTLRGKRIAKKQMIYFPIAPRLQRLYATKNVAQEMRWHAENPRVSGSLAHPSDGEAWKHLDEA